MPGFLRQPAVVIIGRDNNGHSSMNGRYFGVGSGGDNRA